MCKVLTTVLAHGKQSGLNKNLEYLLCVRLGNILVCKTNSSTQKFYFLRVMCEGARGLSVAKPALGPQGLADGHAPSSGDLHIRIMKQ